MQRIKQHKFIWFGIVLLGVILLGMPVVVYAQDEPIANEWVGSSDEVVNYDADSSDPESVNLLGDYVYTPVNPCRIVDTRKAGIPSFGDNMTKSYYSYGSGAEMLTQGGNPAGCPGPRGQPQAVHINVTAVNTTGSGYLTVWAYTKSKPDPPTSVLNYKPIYSDPICNAFTVESGWSIMGRIKNLYVYSYKGTDVVIDVMGYYYYLPD